MNPKASLKSLKVKVRPIASRPDVSDQPGSSAIADFRASAVSRSAMIASRFRPRLYPNTEGRIGDPCLKQPAIAVWGAGNHDADVTMVKREIC
jgi:hypothetical protein